MPFRSHHPPSLADESRLRILTWLVERNYGHRLQEVKERVHAVQEKTRQGELFMPRLPVYLFLSADCPVECDESRPCGACLRHKVTCSLTLSSHEQKSRIVSRVRRSNPVFAYLVLIQRAPWAVRSSQRPSIEYNSRCRRTHITSSWKAPSPVTTVPRPWTAYSGLSLGGRHALRRYDQ